MSTGSTHPTRSHFDAQDFMERAAPGIKSVTEAGLNRYLTATQSSADRPPACDLIAADAAQVPARPVPGIGGADGRRGQSDECL